MSNMNELMRQASFMQQRLQKMQNEMKLRQWTAGVAGDRVVATVSGERRVVAIDIDPEFYKSEDSQMILDSITAAINAAFDLADKEIESAMGQITGGLKIPGLMG